MNISTSHPAPRWRLVLLLVAATLGLAVSFRWRTPPPASPPPFRIVWTFEPPQRGAIAAGTCVAGRWLYLAAIRDNAFRPSGAVYCLDRFTGKPRWQFDAGGTMLHTISTPALRGNQLFVGEGMHGNSPCKLYCLDADTGRQLWTCQVGGHIESGPLIADGHVYLTAGDDGLQAVRVDTGAAVWSYQASGHVDATPWLEDGRLYSGSGVSRRYRQTEAFCLEAKTGRPVWRVPVNLPVWGGPVVDEGAVFLPLGNGRLTNSEPPPGVPAGALVCLDAATGEQRWRYDVGDSVLVRPAITAQQVYFASRDGHCYGLARSGALLWKHDVGGAVVAAPCHFAGRLYVAAVEGPLVAIDAEGRRLWAFDVAERFPSRPQLFSAPTAAPGDGGAPWVYLGTELRGAGRSAAVLICLEDLAVAAP